MAANQPGIEYTRSTSSSRRRGNAQASSVAMRVVYAALAIACAAGGLLMAHAYPIAPLVAMVLFVAWTAFAATSFRNALAGTLALMPVLAFATLTGWMTFEELDLLILASSAGGYFALARRGDPAAETGSRRDGPKLSIFSIALMALFLASLVWSLQRGFDAAGGFRFGWTDGYDDPMNSVRLFKSFAWALLVTPLLLDTLRHPGGFDRIAIGMTLALGLGGLAVLQERLAFTGLLDFSDDYRVTGLFWEMHVGGAALDGFLALTIPFAIREAVRGAGTSGPSSQVRFVGACVVLVMAAYACLVTFSRGVYVAVPLLVLLLVVLVSRQHLRLVRREAWWLVAKGIAFALLVAISAFVVFRGGGYRAVLAILGMLATAIPVEASMRRARIGNWLAAIVAAVLLGAAGHLVASLVPKGPYGVYALAFAAALAAGLQAERKPSRVLAIAAIASWLWLALSALSVARHWGGPQAFEQAVPVVAAWVVLSCAASKLARPLWPTRPHQQLATIGFAALVMGSVAVFTAGAYMGGRFATTRGDLETRTSHWTEGLARMRGTPTWLFGKGLGRFPASSLFDSPDAQSPGSYHLIERGGETFLGLTGPKLRYLGFSELFRFSQRISIKPNTTYRVRLDVRSSAPGAVHIEFCEKQLLYPGGCITIDPKVTGGLDRWQTIEVAMTNGTLGASPWYRYRPVYFAIATGNPSAVLEIRHIAMLAPDGSDLIANGSFTNGTAHWFSSSDKYHLPWHIKNIALAVLFDQGVIGLALFTLLVGGAFLRTTIGRAYRHPDAPYIGAALAGFVVVGAFDSLVDVPRVTYAFYVVTLLGLMLRNPRVARDADRPPAAAPKAPSVDEAAARAKRRAEAFGRRGPIET